jgi:hypothetical protein
MAAEGREKVGSGFEFVEDDGSIYSTELIDLDRLNIILGNPKRFQVLLGGNSYASKTENIKLDQLYKYKKEYTDKNFIAKYSQNNNQGRMWVRGLRLQRMSKQLRDTLVKDLYTDIDAVNCGPTLLKCLAGRLVNQGVPYLREYVAKRNNVIRDIEAANRGMPRSDIKNLILTIIYGGKVPEYIEKTSWLYGFIDEIRDLHSKFREKYHEQIGSIQKDGQKNAVGTFIAGLIQDYENKVLMRCIEYFIQTGVISLTKKNGKKCIDAVLCFDGLMVRDSDKIDLEGLEQYIKKKTGVSISFVEKPLEPIKMSEEEWAELGSQIHDKNNGRESQKTLVQEDGEARYFDATDEYYWMDFMNEILHRSPSSSMYEFELKEFCKKNINRVLIQLITGDFFIKKDKNDLFCPVKQLDNRVITYLVPGKKKDIEISEKFNTYFQSHLTNDIKVYNNLILKPTATHEEVLVSNSTSRDFNMWSGFQAELLKKEDVVYEKIKIIMDHIKAVWAWHDDVKFKYICSWFHHIFKYPYKKTKVAIVFYSEEQQIGKSMIIEEFLQLFVFGRKTCTCETGLGFATERFNEHLMSKLLVSCEELNALEGGFHATFDSMKKLITNKTIKIEIKGGRKFEIDDYMNFILFTNHQFSIKVEKSDARYFITECNPEYKENFEYFNKVSQCFTQENANHFFSYLYWMEDPVEIRKIPETQLKREIKVSCMSNPLKFLYRIKETLDEYNQSENKEDILTSTTWQQNAIEKQLYSSNELYSLYRTFCRDENEKEATHTLFGRSVGKYIEKKRTKSAIMYDLNTIKIT